MPNILDLALSKMINTVGLFQEGWGNRELLERMLESGLVFKKENALEITWRSEEIQPTMTIQQGSFCSPMNNRLFPYASECHQGYVELILPHASTKDTPICIHFAATGDEGFLRRRLTMAIPLIKRGIGSLILENPYYGQRRPQGQIRWGLRRVEDLWAMALGTIEEGRGLLCWLTQMGYRNLGVTGISMGGFMAAAVGALSRRPLAVIPCLSPHSAVPVFTKGMLSHACAWSTLGGEFKKRQLAKKYFGKLLEITDIRTCPSPLVPQAAIIVAARNDSFVPSSSARILHDHWRGSEIRWLNTGHTGAFLFHRTTFHDAITDAFHRLRNRLTRPRRPQSKLPPQSYPIRLSR